MSERKGEMEGAKMCVREEDRDEEKLRESTRVRGKARR